MKLALITIFLLSISGFSQAQSSTFSSYKCVPDLCDSDAWMDAENAIKREDYTLYKSVSFPGVIQVPGISDENKDCWISKYAFNEYMVSDAVVGYATLRSNALLSLYAKEYNSAIAKYLISKEIEATCKM